MMPTHEEGEPVVYCYEIHLEDELHGCVLLHSQLRPFEPSAPFPGRVLTRL
jgi:hypothetical protein